jgi:membrane carboxypeptidase/penicillin-binding protein PbpC
MSVASADQDFNMSSMQQTTTTSHHYEMSQTTTTTQEFSQVQMSQQMSAAFGSSKSSLGQPAIEPLPSDVSISIGKTLTLMTSWSGATANVSWYVNGMEVEETDRIRVDNTGNSSTLSIMNATPDDAGLYRITVKNTNGSDTSETVATIM